MDTAAIRRMPILVPTALAILLGLGASAPTQAQHAPAPSTAPTIALPTLPSTLPPAVAARVEAWQALSLSPSQKLSLLAIGADAMALRTSIQSGVDAALAAADAELASPDADLRAMAAANEAAIDARLAEIRVLRDRLLDFYEHELDHDQQAVAREILRTRLQALTRVRDALVELRAALAQS